MTVTSAAVTGFVARARAAAAAVGHRTVLVLAGEAEWARAQASGLLARTPGEALWLGAESAPPGVRALAQTAARQLLGSETELLVFDAHLGFDPDAFGAVAGTLRAGGLFVLLTPPLERWPAQPDPDSVRICSYPYLPADISRRFVRRLVAVIRAQSRVALITADALPQALPSAPAESPTPPPAPGPWLTADQQRAVQAVEHVAVGHRRRPLVLISDRGHGKSAALGIAAGRLLWQGRRRILVTAPRPQAVRPVFQHAARMLPDAEATPAHVRWRGAEIRFVAPDDLVQSEQKADLVLVDEAAAIPAVLLSRLLRRYARIVFASTVHGYEGTGRGFEVRFRHELDRRTPRWQQLELATPIRWQRGDPLERLVADSLLLDAEAAPAAVFAQAIPVNADGEWLARDCLLAEESLLHELFGLLVVAHYRTTPFDLRLLLDGPGVAVYVLRVAGHVAAAVLVVREGRLPTRIAQAVMAGQRRVRGHLIPQALAAHLSQPEAAALGCDRVLRIAVHPALRRRGLGARLVSAVRERACADGMQLLGTSFGLTDDLLAFWRSQRLTAVRLGAMRDAASGTHSLLMLQGLEESGEQLVTTLARRFGDQLPYQLADTLRDLEPPLAVALLASQGVGEMPMLSAAERQELLAFAQTTRPYEDTRGALWRLAVRCSAEPALSAADCRLLLAKVLQARAWSEVAASLGVPGRDAVIAALRDVCRRAGH